MEWKGPCENKDTAWYRAKQLGAGFFPGIDMHRHVFLHMRSVATARGRNYGHCSLSICSSFADPIGSHEGSGRATCSSVDRGDLPHFLVFPPILRSIHSVKAFMGCSLEGHTI